MNLYFNIDIAKDLYYVTIMIHSNHTYYVVMALQGIDLYYSYRPIKSQIDRVIYLSFNTSLKMGCLNYIPNFPTVK